LSNYLKVFIVIIANLGVNSGDTTLNRFIEDVAN